MLRDGLDVDLSVAKAIALLAYLALTSTPQTRDHLVELFWAESSPDAARKNLRNTLWTLRKALGEEAVGGDSERLTLGEGVWVDVRALERASESPPPSLDEQREIVELYHGPLLDGLVLAEAPEWELWLAVERERLEQRFLRLSETLVEGYRAAGRWDEIIEVARRALAQNRLQESLYRALMEAHARLGERAEALRHFDLLVRVLEEELGVEPLPETDALRAAILSGDLNPLAPLPPVAARPLPARPSEVGDGLPPFVGRAAEMAQMDEALAQAQRGQARVLLLAGEVGIGKSRLWQEWAATLPPEITVLQAACLPATQTLPFAPLVELFASPTLRTTLFRDGSPLSPLWLAEIARLLPELCSTLPHLPQPIPMPPEEERRHLFEALTQALHALNARPLVLFLDDVHWADRATLDWLAYFVHRMQGWPLLLVAAYRPEDALAPLGHLLANWGRQGVTQRINVTPLTPEESTSLLSALLPVARQHVSLSSHLKTQSAGNPYFLIELARVENGDLPPALADLIRARVARLPEAAQQVLQAASILEPAFDFPTLRRTSGRGEEETLDALDALLDAHVLVEKSEHYAFAHPLVASVVREGLSRARRTFLHRRAARARERTHAGRLPQIAAALALHHREAGNPARAAHFFEIAAERALSLSAPDEAIAAFEQARALDPAPARDLALGRALAVRGSLAPARSLFQQALAGFEAAQNSSGAVRASVEIAGTFLPEGRGDEAKRWAARALRYVDAAQDPKGHAAAHFLMGAGLLQSTSTLGEAEAHLLEAARLATENHLLDVAARSRFELGNLLAQQGDLAAAVQAYRDTLLLAEAAGDQIQVALAHNNAAYHSLLLGQLEAAHHHIAAGLRLAEEGDFQVVRQYLYSTRGEIALAEAAWDEAEQWIRRGMTEAERQGNRTQVATSLANLALVARGRGDLDEALLLLDQARARVAEFPATHLQAKIALWLTETFLQRGERAAAADALRQADAQLASGERAGLLAWSARLRGRVGIGY